MPKRKAKKPASKRRPASRSSKPRGGARLPKDAVTLIVLLRSREGQEGILEAELRSLVGPTRREEGCLTYDLHGSADVSGLFLLHEVWSSRDHHKRHTKTPHFLRWDARKDALLASREGSFWSQLV